MSWFIAHSQKGSHWDESKRKYVKVVGGTPGHMEETAKYYYPDSYEGGRHLPKGDPARNSSDKKYESTMQDWEKKVHDHLASIIQKNPDMFKNSEAVIAGIMDDRNLESVKNTLKAFGVSTDKMSDGEIKQLRQKIADFYKNNDKAVEDAKAGKSGTSSKSSSSKSSSSSKKNDSDDKKEKASKKKSSKKSTTKKSGTDNEDLETEEEKKERLKKEADKLVEQREKKQQVLKEREAAVKKEYAEESKTKRIQGGSGSSKAAVKKEYAEESKTKRIQGGSGSSKQFVSNSTYEGGNTKRIKDRRRRSERNAFSKKRLSHSIDFVSDSFLEHHGILGQKWGIRRFQNADGSRTDAGKKRLSLKNRVEKNTGNRKSNMLAKARKDINKLSDEDLRKYNKRLQDEENFKRLTKSDVSAGRKFASTVAMAIITPMAIEAGKKFLTNAPEIARQTAIKMAVRKALRA